MPAAITGSWFPSGFHGHFRSHIRNDICQEYRMAARPLPPKAFAQRIKETPNKHIFSRHDNRHIFPSSVFSFENGLGKKKLLQHRESCNFIYWKPLEEELKKQRPPISTYRTDFWRLDDNSGNAPQLLVPRLNRATSASCFVTTYRDMMRSHSNLKSSEHSALTNNQQILNNTRAETEGVSLKRAKSAPFNRLTVSDCLVWRVPETKNQQSMQNIATS
ncbi:ciliary microtubule inner protein 7 [Pyxicephalus adspersus]|uniref:Domain of unknown function with conserved HDNR motif domain-containing protein n=1 Tax=Pyxicephalus adspersus TaxID=30357 RepID=A0AAV2ZVX6_PYXAD|nr:TPA: hypothetical protein GDO54_016796 [Pyxicephalus adspersus]